MAIWPFRRRQKTSESSIREFVYLDEISVESLLASTDGEVLVERTSTESRSSESSLSGSVEGKTPFGVASFSPALSKSRGNEVQELRKSVAQSAFARFRTKNISQFVIRPLPGRISKGVQRKLNALDASTLRKYGQGLPVAELKRGDLLEIEATIAAADIFKVRTALSAITGVVDSHPSFLTTEIRDQLAMSKPLISLIDSLNGDAIPIRGESASVIVSDVSGEPWLLSPQGVVSPSGQELAVEAQTLARWFWGDVGRILFRPARYKMLCRVLLPELRDDPSGSYVGSILRTVSDDLAQTVDSLGSNFLSALRTGHQQGVSGANVLRTEDVLARYVQLLNEVTEVHGSMVQLSAGETAILGGLSLKQASVPVQTEFFRAIDRAAGVDASRVSEEARGALRDRVRDEFGLWPWSVPTGAASIDTPAPSSPPLLEVEIIAVYW